MNCFDVDLLYVLGELGEVLVVFDGDFFVVLNVFM